MSCGCGTHLVQELELEQTMHSLTIRQRDDALAEAERLRSTLILISQSTALRAETCRLLAQDALGGFAERGEGEA